jgi:hypothetical protein
MQGIEDTVFAGGAHVVAGAPGSAGEVQISRRAGS